MIVENLSTLKINKLTQEQYIREFENGNIDENALYLTPDEDYVTREELVDYATKEELEALKAEILSLIASLDEAKSHLGI